MLLAVILASCASTRKTEAEKQAEAMAIKAMIADSTANRTFTVEVEYVVPRRMESRFLTSTYTVRISGDSIMSNLPYYGVAYKASFEREGPLDFDGHIDNYTISYPKEGITRVKLFKGTSWNGWNTSSTSWTTEMCPSMCTLQTATE